MSTAQQIGYSCLQSSCGYVAISTVGCGSEHPEVLGEQDSKEAGHIESR